MFRVLTPDFAVAGQLQPEDLAAAAEQGYRLIINNRPDNEEPGQPSAEIMAEAASRAGLEYRHIPLRPGGLTVEMITETEMLMEETPGPILAFCRSGTRSATLWALARAKAGAAPQELVSIAGQAGYDLAPMAGLMEQLNQARV